MTNSRCHLLTVLLLGICGCNYFSVQDIPQQHIRFIGESSWSTGVLEGEFDLWQADALVSPGSSYGIWSDGSQGLESKLFFQVPMQWKGSALHAERSFLKSCKEQIRQWPANEIRAVPENISPSDQDGTRKYFVKLPDLESQVWDASAWTEKAPLHTIFLGDVSGSSFQEQEAVISLQAAFWKHVIASDCFPGSTFEVWQIGKTRDSAKRLWFHNMKSLTEEGRVVDAYDSYQALRKFRFPKAPNASAVLASLNRSTAAMKERTGRYLLFIMSDLREATSGGFHFEGKIPTPERFLKYARAKELITDLSDVDVQVVGVHDRKGSKSSSFTAVDAKKLKEVWHLTFKEMGTQSLLMFSSPQNAFPEWRFPTQGGSL